MTTEDDVRRICLSLPETVEKPSWGTPGFRVNDKLFTRLRYDPDALVVMVNDLLEKDALIAAEPDIYFQIPHYEGYPAVLVRLEAVAVEQLEEILIEAWSVKAPAKLVDAFAARRENRKP